MSSLVPKNLARSSSSADPVAKRQRGPPAAIAAQRFQRVHRNPTFAKSKAYPRKAKSSRPARARPTENARHFDAGSRSTPVPVPDIISSSVCIPTVGRMLLSSPTTANQFKYLVCQWSACSIRGVTIEHNLSFAPDVRLLQYETDGTPTSLRPGCLSLRLRNITKNDNLEGVVRALVVPQPLEWDITADRTVSQTFVNELKSMLENNPDAKSFTAQNFSTEKAFVIPPASIQQYKTPRNFQPISATVSTQDTIIKENSAEGKMCTMILQFPATANANLYDIAVHDQSFGRYPANTMYSQLQVNHAATSSAEFSKQVKFAAENAGRALPASMM